MIEKPQAQISSESGRISPAFAYCCMFIVGFSLMSIHVCGNLWTLVLTEAFGGQVYNGKVATYSVQQLILLSGIIGCALSLLTGCVGRISCICSNWILCYSYFMASIYIYIRRNNLHEYVHTVLRFTSWISFINHCLQASSIFLLFDDNIPGGRNCRMLRLTSYFCGCSVTAPLFTPYILRMKNLMTINKSSITAVDPTNIVVQFGLCFALMGVITAASASCISYMFLRRPYVAKMDESPWFPFLWYPYSKLCRDALNMYSLKCTGIIFAWANNPTFIPYVMYISIMSGDGGHGMLIITRVLYALVFMAVDYLATFSDDIVSLIQSKKETLKQGVESMMFMSIKPVSSGTYNVFGSYSTTPVSTSTDTIEYWIERPESISPVLPAKLATHVPVEVPWYLLQGSLGTEWERRDTQYRLSLTRLTTQYHTLADMESMIHENDILDVVSVMKACHPHINSNISGCWDSFDNVDPWDIVQGTLDNQRDILLHELDNISNGYIFELASAVDGIMCSSTGISNPPCCYCLNIGHSVLCEFDDDNPVTRTADSNCHLCSSGNIDKVKKFLRCSLQDCGQVAKKLKSFVISDVTKYSPVTNQEDVKKRNFTLAKTLKSRLQQCQSVLLLLNVLLSVESTILLWQHCCSICIKVDNIITGVTDCRCNNSDNCSCCLLKSQLLPLLFQVVRNMHDLKSRTVSRVENIPGILLDGCQYGPLVSMDVFRSIVLIVEGIDVILKETSIDCGMAVVQGCVDILRRINCRCELDTALADTIMLFHPLSGTLGCSAFSYKDTIERTYGLRHKNTNVDNTKCKSISDAVKKCQNGNNGPNIFDCNKMEKGTSSEDKKISCIKSLAARLNDLKSKSNNSGFSVQEGTPAKTIPIISSCSNLSSQSCSTPTPSGSNSQCCGMSFVVENMKTLCNCSCTSGETKSCTKCFESLCKNGFTGLTITPCTAEAAQSCSEDSCNNETQKTHRFLNVVQCLADSMNWISNNACTAGCCGPGPLKCCHNSDASCVDLGEVLKYIFGCSSCKSNGCNGCRCANGEQTEQCPGDGEALCNCMLRLFADMYCKISCYGVSVLHLKCPCCRSILDMCQSGHNCCVDNGVKKEIQTECKCEFLQCTFSQRSVACTVNLKAVAGFSIRIVTRRKYRRIRVTFKTVITTGNCNCFSTNSGSKKLGCIRLIHCINPKCWRCYFRCYVICGPGQCKNQCNGIVTSCTECCGSAASGSSQCCDLCTFRKCIFYCSECLKKGTPLFNALVEVVNIVGEFTVNVLTGGCPLYASSGSGKDITFGCDKGHRLGCAVDIIKKDLTGLDATLKSLKTTVDTLKNQACTLKGDVINAKKCVDSCHKIMSYIFMGLWARVERLNYIIPHVEAMKDLYCRTFKEIGNKIETAGSSDQAVIPQLATMLSQLKNATQGELNHTPKVLGILCKIKKDNDRLRRLHGGMNSMKNKQNTNWKDLVRTRNNKFGLVGVQDAFDSSSSCTTDKRILKYNIHQNIPAFLLNVTWYILWIRSIIIYLSLKLYHAEVGANVTLIIVNTVLSAIAMQTNIHTLNNELMNDGVVSDVYSIIVNFIWLLSLLFTFAVSISARVFDQYLMHRETMDDISTGSRMFDYSDHQPGVVYGGFISSMLSTFHTDFRSLLSVFFPTKLSTGISQTYMDTSLYHMVNNNDMIWYPNKSRDYSSALADIRDNVMNHLAKTPGLIMDLYSFSRLPPCVLSMLDLTNRDDGPREGLSYRLEWYWQSWIHCVPITEDLIYYSSLRSKQLLKLTKEFMKHNVCCDSGILMKLRRLWNGYTACEFSRIVERTFADAPYNHTALIDSQFVAMGCRLFNEYISRWRAYQGRLWTFVNPSSLDADPSCPFEYKDDMDNSLKYTFPSQERHDEYKRMYMRSAGCDDILSEHVDYVDMASPKSLSESIEVWQQEKLQLCTKLGEKETLCTRVIRDCMYGFERFMHTWPDNDDIVSNFAKFLLESEDGIGKIPHSLVYQALVAKGCELHVDGLSSEMISMLYSFPSASTQKYTLYSHIKDDISSSFIFWGLKMYGLWSNGFVSSYGLWFMLNGGFAASSNGIITIKNAVWNN